MVSDAYGAYNVCGGLECLWCLEPMVPKVSVVSVMTGVCGVYGFCSDYVVCSTMVPYAVCSTIGGSRGGISGTCPPPLLARWGRVPIGK